MADASETTPLVEQVEVDVSNTQTIMEKITSGVELARGALEEAKHKVTEYDGVHNAAEKASSFLHTSIEKAQAAVAELGVTAQSLKGAGEIPVKGFSNAIAKASSALSGVVDAAKTYDEKHNLSATVSSAIAGPREQASAAIASIAAYVTAAANTANAQLLGVTAGVVTQLRSAATGALDKAIPIAARADEKLHVTEKGAAATSALLQRVRELDERFGFSQYVAPVGGHAQELDRKVTGGKIAPALANAYTRGLSMVSQVAQQFEDKKKELHPEAQS
eukprot:TRINITY_DN10204_c0_g1_i1.p1 TRINITY_DN10204_c0_g1~~TRINITY_DN10204_c0_g1_i1.p1  ORF type:complete len:277 (+),score=66.63 TRINITY_DN10204_c0_g1_i1:62-892(+)